jgi:hypothetical protein
MFETLSSGGPAHWPRSILGGTGFALFILGGAFYFVGLGRWTLLLIIAGGVLEIVDRSLQKESEHPPAI